jgi:hypothetical protein
MYEKEVNQIESAFSEVPYPGDEDIIRCGYVPTCEEWWFSRKPQLEI